MVLGGVIEVFFAVVTVFKLLWAPRVVYFLLFDTRHSLEAAG